MSAAELRKRIEDLVDSLDEVAYHQISLEKMLTIQTTGVDRAKVPPHWQAAADDRAAPYRRELIRLLDEV